MSPDTTFAAQFWLWPDPALKRDAQGRILFVNAAFLQLYGGSVDAWTGNVIQGWPAPQPTEPGAYPVPSRFETRIPSQDPNIGEEVYDWMEQSNPDGTAFALARNVTVFVQKTAQPPAGPPPGLPLEAEAQPTVTPQIEQTWTEAPAQPEAAPATTPAPQNEPEYAQAEISQPAPQIEEPTPESVMPVEVTESVTQTQVEAPAVETSTTQNSADIYAEVPEAASVTPPQNETEERPYERRALPIESDSAILGNNWRDAVIAKAVGAEASAEETTPEVPVTAPAAPEATTGSEGPKRILLAEDNAINALLTRTLLEAEGHTVETVEDGALAVEAMKTQNFDLIFMDMRMPNMDGLESTRKIRQLPNVPKNLPIIALTANAFDDDRNACFDSGMNDFMTKPVSAEELSEMVTTWTGQKQAQMAS